MANMSDDLDAALATSTNSLEEYDEDKLIFPINVTESLKASGSLKKGERNGIIISFWVFGCALLAWVLAGWLRQILPQWYLLIVIGVEVALQLTVGLFLLRFVLDERTMMMEASGQDNSFARYFSIYHEVIAEEGSTYPFDFIEFSDGSYGVYIQFLLGYNTNQASEATHEVNTLIPRLINRSGMGYRIFYSNEKFGNSASADEMRKGVGKISDPRLFKAYRDIVQGLLQTANEESNVVCTTYVIYAKTQIQKDELATLVNNILNVVRGSETAYREVSVLDYSSIVEFYRNYYKLDVLDMGMVRAHQVQKKKIACTLKVLKIYGKSGKVYTTGDYSALQKFILDSDGLKQVNASEKSGKKAKAV